MAFPTNPSPGDSYTDEYGTVWVYAGAVNGWYRQTVTTPNDTSYTAAISGPAGSNTQVQFNDNGELAGDSGLTYNKTTDALSGGAFIPTGSTVPSNGLYRPSANNVALSTNGTGRLFVDASGNVNVDSGTVYVDAANNRLGVGTTSPDALLTVSAGNSASVSNTRLRFVDTDTTAAANQYLGRIEFFGSDVTGPGAGVKSAITAKAETVGGDSYLTFSTSSTSLNDVERLRITSAGLVGIGTSSPGAKLTVAQAATNADTDGIRIVDSGGSTRANLYYRGSQVFEINSSSAPGGEDVETLRLSTAGNARLSITRDGKVGIGTTGPQSNLEVSASEASITVAATAPGASGVSGSGWFRIRDNTNAYDVAAIRGLSENPTKLGSLIFYNAASGVLTERARLMAEGYFRFNAPSAQPGVVFQINSSEVARVDSSGRLLVGTSTAQGSNLLQIEGDTASAANPGGIFLRRGLTSAEIGGVVGRNLGDISFGTKNGDIGAQIRADSDAAMSTGDSPTRLVFSTTADGASSPTERMRINSNGFQASTSTANGIEMGVTASAGTSTLIFRGRHSATAGSYATGTVAFNVWSNGNVTNTNNSYGAISDIKLKENIVDANSQWNDLKALQVRNYNFKEGQTHTQIGLIAQEVELVSPGLVTESPDRDEDGNDLGTVTKSVNYSVLYMKAVKALQEAMERIETLEQRLNDAGIN